VPTGRASERNDQRKANVEAAVVHREPMQAEVVWKLVRQPPREGGLTFDTGRYQLTPGCTPAADDAPSTETLTITND